MRVTVVLAAVAATIRTVSAPPYISEPFTPLPCPVHPVAAVALEGCAQQDLLRDDGLINALTKSIYLRLPSAGARTTFRDSEYAWLGYRRRSCEVEASPSAGGIAKQLKFLRCEQRRDRTHLADLEQLRAALP